MQRIELPGKGLYCRKGIYYFRKVIPAKLRKPGTPTEIILSLHTRDKNIALARYAHAKSSAEEEIKMMRDKNYVPSGKTDDFIQSQMRAQSQGRELKDIRVLVSDRLAVREAAQALRSRKHVTKSVVRSFLCENDKEPRIRDLPLMYEKAHNYEFKSNNPREYARKIDPLKNACNQLIDFLKENRKISALSKKDAKNFYDHLRDRIYNDEITANTASKYLTHLRVLINDYYKENGLEIVCVFSNLRFKEEKNRRSPLDIKHIKKEWIDNDALSTLNSELKFIIFAMIDTGCNFKELCGLDPQRDIRLQDAIPHIILRDNQYRQLKTPFRERRIPLVGLALKAFINSPNGFPRYQNANGPTNASAAINKFLKENKLFQNNGQTAYSVRHCFKDRLREYGIASEMQDYLMGHKSPGMGAHYGNGYTLEKIKTALLQIEADLV